MAIFLSRCPNQVLTIKPARKQIVEGEVIPVPGQRVSFENGRFETTDKTELEFLRKHRLNGSAFFEDKKADKPAGNPDPNKPDGTTE
jgi:hypothetical protein